MEKKYYTDEDMLCIDSLNNIKKMVERPLDNEYIYHYTSAEGLYGILSSNSLWFTRWDFLNDPNEKIYFTKVILDGFTRNTYELDFVNLIKSYSELANPKDYSNSPDNYFVCSFSVDSDSLDMWKYYSKNKNSHGYNLAMDVSKLSRSLSDYNETLISSGYVIYKKDEQDNVIDTILQGLYNIYKSNLGEKEKRSLILTWFFRFRGYAEFFMKHIAYSSEKEYRFVCKNIIVAPKHQATNFRIVNGVYIPYIDLKFDKECISSAFLSPTLHDNVSAKIGLENILKYLDYNDVQIFQSKIPFRNV